MVGLPGRILPICFLDTQSPLGCYQFQGFATALYVWWKKKVLLFVADVIYLWESSYIPTKSTKIDPSEFYRFHN